MILCGGWGVALLLQATPPAARALLGHEGWRGAITAVAETAEALQLRAGGVQCNVRAAAVTKAGATPFHLNLTALFTAHACPFAPFPAHSLPFQLNLTVMFARS
jgi:hypothetical protein